MFYIKGLTKLKNRKYLFLANSSKPTEEEYNSIKPIRLNNFYLPNIKSAIHNNCDVYVGINRKYPKDLDTALPVEFYDANIFRSITDVKNNYRAYKNLMNFITQKNIDVIHCNTPIGGLLGRICGRKKNVNKIIYTVHGFHFYKGQNAIKRYLFKSIERYLAKSTDAIITINEEDFQSAKSFKLKKHGKVYKVHGVGIQTSITKTSSIEISKIKKDFHLKNQDIVLLTVGDLVKNKNIKTIIKSMRYLDNKYKLFICGQGVLDQKLKNYTTKLKLSDRIFFLGYRNDISTFYSMADIFVFSSFREGLPRVTMEAMSYGLPCVVSKIRGNIDLIDNGQGGFLCKTKDFKGIANKIKYISQNKKIYDSMSKWNLKKIKKYDVKYIQTEIDQIYSEILGDREN